MSYFNHYKKTHFNLKFKAQDWVPVIDSLRKAYGDNDPYQKFIERPWFTQGHTIYIRRDLYTESFTTFLFLNCIQKNEE
jgi:hypothetical protein